MKKQHVRKIIAPVAIVVVLLLVLVAYGFGMIESPVPLWSKWLVGGILAALGGVVTVAARSSAKMCGLSGCSA